VRPFFLFIDEAHEFSGKQKDSVSDIIRLISMEGRKFGINLAVITQRPQALDVNVRSQAGTWIIHKLTDTNDVNITCKSAEGLSPKTDDEIIQSLDIGEALIVGEISPLNPILLKIRERHTVHGGTGFNLSDLVPDTSAFSVAPLIQKLRNEVKPEKLAEAHENRVSKILTLSEYESLSNSLLEERDHLMEVIQEKTRHIEQLKKESLEMFDELKKLRDEVQKQKLRADEAVDIAERTLSELKKR
jgi:DNA segregation ATPase FtsK/SpoIIIE-like protein